MSFTPEQQRIFFTHLASLDNGPGRWLYLTWMDWAAMLDPNPYDRPPTLREALIPLLARGVPDGVIPVAVLDADAYLNGKIAERSPRMIHDVFAELRPVGTSSGKHADKRKAPSTVFGVPAGSRLDVKFFRVGKTLYSAEGPDAPAHLKGLIAQLRASWAYASSAGSIAERLRAPMQRPTVLAAWSYDPKSSTDTGNIKVDLTMTQRSFIATILNTDAPPKTVSEAVYMAIGFALKRAATQTASEAFWTDDAEKQAEVVTEHKLAIARRHLEVQRIKNVIAGFKDLALYQRICQDLKFRYPKSARTPQLLLAALKPEDRAAVESRRTTLLSMLESMRYNACEHTQLTQDEICQRSDEFIVESGLTSDPNAKLLCKICGLPLLCPHVLARYHVHLKSAAHDGNPNSTLDADPGRATDAVDRTQLNTYIRKQGRLSLCKLCGEVLSEDLWSDFDMPQVEDPDFRRVAYGRYMLCKSFVTAGEKAITMEARIIKFVYKPLFEQFAAIDALRGATVEHREALQRLYSDIYLLAAFGLLGYKVNTAMLSDSRDNREVSDRRPGSAVAGLIAVVQRLQGKTLGALGYDYQRLEAILSMAVKGLKHQMAGLAEIQVVNADLIDINCSPLLRYILTGSLWTTDPFVNTDADVAAIGSLNDRVRRDMPKLPPSLKSLAAAWLEAPIPFTLPITPKQPNAEDAAREQKIDEHWVLRRINRFTFVNLSHTAPIPGALGRRYFRGLVDLTRYFKLSPLDDSSKGNDSLSGSSSGPKYAAPNSLPPPEAERWAATMASGRSPSIALSSAESEPLAKAIIRRVNRDLFIEMFSSLCPEVLSKDNISAPHDRNNPNEPCKNCKATANDVYTSDSYFTKYESVFLRTSLKPFELNRAPPHKPGVVVFRSELTPDTNTADRLRVAATQIAKLVETSEKYVSSLGDLGGRTYADVLLPDDRAPRFGNTRFMLLCAYYQRTCGMLGYFVRHETHGAHRRDEAVAKYLGRAERHPPVTQESLLDRITKNTAFYYSVTPRMEPESCERAIIDLICDWCNDMLALAEVDPAFTKVIIRAILEADALTANYDRGQVIASGPSDQEMDNDFNEIDDGREVFAADSFYQDFTFEGGMDQIAIRD